MAGSLNQISDQELTTTSSVEFDGLTVTNDIFCNDIYGNTLNAAGDVTAIGLVSGVSAFGNLLSTTTTSGTATLSFDSAQNQYFTGTLDQTVRLPASGSLIGGQSYTIINGSTGTVTVQSSGANTLEAMSPGTVLHAVRIATGGTGTDQWSWQYGPSSLSLPLSVANGGTGITSFGTGVATALGQNVTGSGGMALDTSPTFTTQITSPTVITTGAANTQKEFTANSGAAITINPSDGAYQTITLTDNTTITLGAVPSAASEREFILELVQDGTGGRTVSWANITFATNSGANPAINSTAGGSTFIGISGTNTAWIGYPVNQGLGVTDGSNASAGYIGEVIASTLAIGSATSMTTGTGKTITSISLTPGDWMVDGNIGFIAAAGTLPTELIASISATDNTQATSPNGGAFAQLGLSFTAASTNVLTLSPTRINITSAATYYLVGTAAFTVSTLTAYGSISARRFR